MSLEHEAAIRYDPRELDIMPNHAFLDSWTLESIFAVGFAAVLQ